MLPQYKHRTPPHLPEHNNTSTFSWIVHWHLLTHALAQQACGREGNHEGTPKKEATAKEGRLSQGPRQTTLLSHHGLCRTRQSPQRRPKSRLPRRKSESSDCSTRPPWSTTQTPTTTLRIRRAHRHHYIRRCQTSLRRIAARRHARLRRRS